jgi:hypothetical protein
MVWFFVLNCFNNKKTPKLGDATIAVEKSFVPDKKSKEYLMVGIQW